MVARLLYNPCFIGFSSLAFGIYCRLRITMEKLELNQRIAVDGFPRCYIVIMDNIILWEHITHKAPDFRYIN